MVHVDHGAAHGENSEEPAGRRWLSSTAGEEGSEGSASQDSSPETSTEVAIALLLTIRIWRVVRVLHGVAFSEKLRHDEHKKLTNEVKDEAAELRRLERENGELRREMEEERAGRGGGGAV